MFHLLLLQDGSSGSTLRPFRPGPGGSVNTRLNELLAEQTPEVRAEIVRINTEARPVSLQIALLIPLLAALLGLLNSIRMRRLPDPKPSNADGVVLG